MSISIPTGTDLYRALKLEGFDLPDNCGDLTLELPVDGAPTLHYRIMMFDDALVKFSKALVRVGQRNFDA